MHLIGIPAAVAATLWLAFSIGPTATGTQRGSLLIYGFGLIGMLTASAAYNLARPSRAKALLQRLDHAMIFVMIAGSYTPFALNALGPRLGLSLCGAVWGLAMIGIVLKLACFHRVERASLALYLGMGWLLLVVIRPLVAALSGEVLALLLGGGIVYSAGSIVHTRGRIPFHNAIWHTMVLVAAGLHLAAVTKLLMAS